MTEPATAQTMSAAEYLAWEREQLDKHEFHHGQVIERPACSVRHCLLSTAIGTELHRAGREHGCVGLASMRVGTPDREHYMYPDALLVCGSPETEPNTKDVLINPTVVVEVLAANTEAYDRGLKWQAYQLLRSLTDYLLVAQQERRIEHYRRGLDGSWWYRVYETGDLITLANQAQVAVYEVYRCAFDFPGG
jgi:Uma2 family endonuclease